MRSAEPCLMPFVGWHWEQGLWVQTFLLSICFIHPKHWVPAGNFPLLVQLLGQGLMDALMHSSRAEHLMHLLARGEE